VQAARAGGLELFHGSSPYRGGVSVRLTLPAWQTGEDGESAGWPRHGLASVGTVSRKVGAPQGRVLVNGQSG
jgi:hypothetical protein